MPGRPMLTPSQPSPAPNPQLALMGVRAAEEDPKVYGWILELMQGTNRETALLELSKKREQVDDLALILWHSVGMIWLYIHVWDGLGSLGTGIY